MTRQVLTDAEGGFRSTAVRSVGYDDATMVLEVEFHPTKKDATRSAIWWYAPVSRATFDEIVNPENSAGAVFHASIRMNRSVVGEFKGWHDVESGLPIGMPA